MDVSMDGCAHVRECIWMIHHVVVPSNLCMHTIPNVSVNPIPLSGDLSVLATFIQLKVIDFCGCKLVTGRCGGGGERGEWVTYRDFYLGVQVHRISYTIPNPFDAHPYIR